MSGIVDAQLHVTAEHPPEQLLAMMSDVGVSAAVLVHTRHHGYDLSYGLDAVGRNPVAFRFVGALDPDAPDLSERFEWLRANPLVIGLRILVRSDEDAARLRAGTWEPLLSACERSRLPVFFFAPLRFAELGEVARTHPELQLVIDHFGLPQPPSWQPSRDPWAPVSELLELSRYANVAIKWTAAPTLSVEPYPFPDLWPQLHAVLSSFGLERVMWGSDITRVAGMHTYKQAVDYLRTSDKLGDGEKALLLGGTLRTLLKWQPQPSPISR